MADTPYPTFYLPDPSLADLADAFIAIGDVELPVHSQLLSLQSAVLRELFRGERERGNQVRRAPWGGRWAGQPVQAHVWARAASSMVGWPREPLFTGQGIVDVLS